MTATDEDLRSFGALTERTPPHDTAAEQSALGGMMLSKDAVADVVEILRSQDFYSPAHEMIYDAITDLYGRGQPTDVIAVADELTKRGELPRVGGHGYLHTLIASVPTAANAGFYAGIVRERAVLRKLVEAGTRIAQLGYATDGGDVDELVNNAQSEIYAVTERRTSEDYRPLRDIIGPAMDEIENASNRDGTLVGVPTGFAELDSLTNGLHAGQMIVVAARPAMGKSTFALDIARSASVHHQMTSVIFSLEMGASEIMMRMLAAEARVPLQKLRQGPMDDRDWQRIAATASTVSDAPMFVDDSPNMTLMEIRAKCRRLKQRHDLKLVVIDYLQLMTSGKRVESRQQEVSEFSRAIKLLAKELEVPVIAVSQLNRGAEQRTDKRPQMSDLRESGCLTADTRVLRADTGAETTMGELFALGSRDVPVWALDERARYVRRHLTHVFSTGVKPTFRLRLASGKQVRATANHPFLTVDGWTALGSLAVGSRVGVPRHVPAPQHRAGGDGLADPAAWSDREVAVLARVLAGCGQPREIEEMADRVWLARGGIPQEVFSLPKHQIALFLGNLFGHSARVTSVGGDRILLVGHDRAVLDGVARLLLRFGISCRVSGDSDLRPGSGARAEPGLTRRERRLVGRRGRHAADSLGLLDIHEADDQRRFLTEIGLDGEAAAAMLARLRDQEAERGRRGSGQGASSGTGSGAAGPLLWEDVAAVLGAFPAPGTGGSGSGVVQSGSAMGRVARVLERAELEVHAVNDLMWDEIVAIEPAGEEEVFDATVSGGHNFVANGIAVHNSIEQDADMVILLHRDEVYDKDARPGEADFIVAKHRNGPTANITVSFQGHYARFVDMAPDPSGGSGW